MPSFAKTADIECSYTIKRKVEKSKYFAIDGLYLDLTAEQGERTVWLLFPKQIYDKFTSGDIFRRYGSQLWKQGPQELHLVAALVSEENPPSFVSIVDSNINSNDGQAIGAMLIRDEGILTEVMKHDSHRHLYKITGFFTMKAVNVGLRDLRTAKMIPTHGLDLVLTLVGLRAFSTHDDLLERLSKKNQLVNAKVFGK